MISKVINERTAVAHIWVRLTFLKVLNIKFSFVEEQTFRLRKQEQNV